MTSEDTQIKDLQPGMTGVSVKAVVLYKMGVWPATNNGRAAHIFQIADTTGSIVAVIWEDKGKKVEPNTIICMTECTTALWTGCLQLYSARNGGHIYMSTPGSKKYVLKVKVNANIHNDMSRVGLFLAVQPSAPGPKNMFNTSRVLTVKRNLELSECSVVDKAEDMKAKPIAEADHKTEIEETGNDPETAATEVQEPHDMEFKEIAGDAEKMS